MSIIKHVTLQKIVAHDFRYDPRKWFSRFGNVNNIEIYGIHRQWTQGVYCPTIYLCLQFISVSHSISCSRWNASVYVQVCFKVVGKSNRFTKGRLRLQGATTAKKKLCEQLCWGLGLILVILNKLRYDD